MLTRLRLQQLIGKEFTLPSTPYTVLTLFERKGTVVYILGHMNKCKSRKDMRTQLCEPMGEPLAFAEVLMYFGSEDTTG
jgi:hypothetical protein